MRSLLVLILILVPLPAAAGPFKVGVEVRSTAGSWQPIAPADLSRAIENAALEELSRPGQLQLSRGQKGDLSDLLLLVEGRLLDEAQTYTVALTIGPGARADAPSLTAAETVVLEKLSRAQILEKVEAAARAAAKGLWGVLGPQLARLKDAGQGGPPPNLDADKTLPWQWGAVRIPKASLASAADLDSKDHQKRQAALRELTSLALSEASPRHALERCALDHKDQETRRGCLEALRPLSRKPGPTQRVVIEVYRKDPDSRIREEAIEQMLYFTGAGKSEAIQAFLEAASLGKGYGPLAELGDLPNLDLVIVKCLLARKKGEARPTEGQHFGCIELLEPLTHARRRAILWPFLKETDKNGPRYLEGAGEREGSTGTPWARAVDALLEDATSWDPELEDVLWGRYQRTLSSHSLQVLCDYAIPSQRLLERMLEVVQTAGAACALRAVEKMGKAEPKLGALAKDRLAEMQAMGNFQKGVSADDLGRVIQAISRGGK